MCSTSNNTCRWQRVMFFLVYVACGNHFIIGTIQFHCSFKCNMHDLTCKQIWTMLCSISHSPPNTGQSARRTDTFFCHLLVILLQTAVTWKILKCGNGHFIAAWSQRSGDFCWAMQKVKSTFDWSIAVQFGINVHSWYIHSLTINIYKSQKSFPNENKRM